jgi:hypothetical protein
VDPLIVEWRRPSPDAIAVGRGVRSVIAWCAFALLALHPIAGHAADYTIGPPPAWVVETQPGVATSAQLNQASDGVAYLLVDNQIRSTADGRTRYHRVVSNAINAKGVESIANIQIPFDPSYQTLTLHSINVIRGGRVIPKLATAKIQVFQRETELDARIYDGTKTVNVFLDDVRVGDTIDGAYSTTGSNPVFNGLEFGTMDFQFNVPLARIHGRLLLPVGQPVTMEAHHTVPKPVVTQHDGFRDYTWDITDVPELTIEEGAPFWYTPYPQVEWSQFANWASVVRWALPLYRVPDTLSRELELEVQRIAKFDTKPSERLLAALRLVQGDVRYLGVETGRNSHAPNPPALVFERRFGDCKDKVLLTLALLDRLGIDAHAALVNTSIRRGITNVLPNPAAFDHVLVQARINGKVYWIDPTRPTQNADLDHLFQPDFDLALVVARTTQTLTSMKDPAAAQAKRSVHVVFDARHDFTNPVRYTVVTTDEGEAAESQRTSLSSTNIADMQKNYLQYYANSYPGITVAVPLAVDDDKLNNRITTTETYDIPNIASKADKGGTHKVSIYTPDVDDLLRDPKITIRKAPLQVNYPLDVTQTTEVLLPDEWPITPDVTTIEDPAFTFDQSVKLDGLTLTITDHFKALTDEIAAKDMPRYTGNLERARDEIGYQLTWTEPVPASKAKGIDRMNWPIALLAMVALGFWIWLAVIAYRFNPAARNDGIVGMNRIRGWLLLLAIGVLLTPFTFGSTLFHVANAMSADTWAALTTYGNARYSALWAPLLLLELVENMGQFVFSLLLLVLFFRHRSSYPRLAIGFFVIGCVLQFADIVLGGLTPIHTDGSKEAAVLARQCIATVIWTIYLLRSRRVKATFVKRRPGSTPESRAPRRADPPIEPPPAMDQAIVEPA